MNEFTWIAVLVCLTCAAGAGATERKAYKYVDEKGNVTYSQTPPANKDAKAVDISPAHQGRGGYTGRDWSTPYGSDYNPGHRQDRGRAAQRRREEARKQRLARLEAECHQSRGTDCKNPDTLRYIDSQRIPRSGKP